MNSSRYQKKTQAAEVASDERKKQRKVREKEKKKLGPLLELCVSSLRRGHTNLLCIVPILSDVSEETLDRPPGQYNILAQTSISNPCGSTVLHATTHIDAYIRETGAFAEPAGYLGCSASPTFSLATTLTSWN